MLLLVRACRAQAASLQQLHVLNWALRSTRGAEQLGLFLAGELAAEQPAVRYEPALDRAVALAGGLELLTFDRKLWRLNDAGRALVAHLDEDPSLLSDEKQRLAIIGTPLTQAAVSGLLRREPTAA
ncbi:hypothetical protein [Candidatus Solirubrobacter pratensis]|uniref:hypothetical protein n=1 Tax=Candidatus Solirubrobacter pratensis TaxID=1298857 RepID=UPI0012DE8B1C|nr:hypothetical protein [Candidatus Solirubrobacter pratensis]